MMPPVALSIVSGNSAPSVAPGREVVARIKGTTTDEIPMVGAVDERVEASPE